MAWESFEEAFKELDSREFSFFARALGSYRKALELEGFSNREAMRLVEGYAKFIYEMSLDEIAYERNSGPNDNDDVDPDDDLT